MTVRAAGREEAGEIVRVINAAFNRAASFFVDGDRIDFEQVQHYFEKGVFLVAEELAGCVYVELRGERAYIGLLSVDPARQKGGVGKALMDAAESYARGRGCRAMDLRIVNLRLELPAFTGSSVRGVGHGGFTPGRRPGCRATSSQCRRRFRIRGA